jgi:nitrite reductase/ring-hydroxylating ferredoxin subunit
MSGLRLCALDDIPAEGSNGFVAEISGQAKSVFAVRKGDQVYVYENICPGANFYTTMKHTSNAALTWRNSGLKTVIAPKDHAPGTH